MSEQPLCYLYPATKRQRPERTEGHSHFQALKRWPWPYRTCGQHYKARGHCFSGMDGPWLIARSSIFSVKACNFLWEALFTHFLKKSLYQWKVPAGPSASPPINSLPWSSQEAEVAALASLPGVLAIHSQFQSQKLSFWENSTSVDYWQASSCPIQHNLPYQPLQSDLSCLQDVQHSDHTHLFH